MNGESVKLMSSVEVEKIHPGDYVRYSLPNNGTTDDQYLAESRLTLNAIYQIEHISRGDWCTDLYLEKIPSVSFNSVLFESVKVITPRGQHIVKRVDILLEGKREKVESAMRDIDRVQLNHARSLTFEVDYQKEEVY
jgi:hypothetical protein